MSGCADLPTGDLNRCGNRVVEQELGEDCDGSADAFDPDAECSAECRLVCGDDSVCPPAYACGEDGICRTRSGEWQILETVADRGEWMGAVELLALQSDDDARSELLRVSLRTSVGADGDAVNETSCAIERFRSDAPHSSAVLECFDQQLTLDVDSDGLGDILAMMSPALGEPPLSPSSLYEVYLGADNLERSRPQPSFMLGESAPTLYSLRTSESFVRIVARDGRDVSVLDAASFRVRETYPDLLPQDPPSDARIAVLLLRSGTPNIFGELANADALVAAFENPGRVEAYNINLDPGAVERVVRMPDGMPLLGSVTTVDINDDGIADLLANDAEAPFFAFGYADGSFGAAPPTADETVPGDNRFAPAAPDGPMARLFGPQSRGALLAAADINGSGVLNAVYERVLVTDDDSFGGEESFRAVSAQAVDIDVNGNLDFVTLLALPETEYQAGPGLAVIRADAQDGAVISIVEPNPSGPFSVADFDADTVPDLLFVRPSQTTPGWQELALARGRPLQPPEPPVALAAFPSISGLLLHSPSASVSQFAAVVQVDSGASAAALFRAETEPSPMNLWSDALGPESDEPLPIIPGRWVAGEFDGELSSPDLALLANTPGVQEDASVIQRFVHLQLGTSPRLGVLDGRASGELPVSGNGGYYAVMTRIGLSATRDAVLLAVPNDQDRPAAGSRVLVGMLSGDRVWSAQELVRTTELIADKPAVFVSDYDRTDETWAPLRPLYRTDPLGDERPGAAAFALDIDEDGVDEALIVSGAAGDPWFLFGRDGAGAVGLRALVVPPSGRVEDVVADPGAAGGVIWTGTDGTFAGRVDVLAPGEGSANAYEVATATLVEVHDIEPLGGVSLAAGDFDGDGLSDVALGDAASVRIYRASPSID